MAAAMLASMAGAAIAIFASLQSEASRLKDPKVKTPVRRHRRYYDQ